MAINYLTVKQKGSFEINIQKSRFIGHATRAYDEKEAQTFIHNLKKEHYNANHNCFAYMIGDNNQIQKASDDGEPSGTAGVPILEVLKNLNLKNTVVVVTRYFGGIKLGAGGLIRAYSSTTSETIKHIGIVQRTLMQGYLLTIPYHLLGKIEHFLHASPYLIDNISYQENVEFAVYIDMNSLETFKNDMVNLTSDQAVIKKHTQKYMETAASVN